ncbi:MAG TPA: hypothetical protein ENJ60_11100 [Aeromonadales bacterium]|nr:hypothetical protein [Aeromonadales bacterium]
MNGNKPVAMKIKIIEFTYKGTRNYIHGTDMFNRMMTEIPPGTLVEKIIFTVHNVVHSTKCHLYCSEDKTIINKLDNISVRCKYEIEGITYWMAISEAEDTEHQSEKKRVAYDESKITELCNMIDNSITLSGESPYSFIETVVAMNKYMLQQLFPDVTGKWFFTRIDLPVLCSQNENINLILRHNINYKLIKTEIKSGGDIVGNIFFSLVNV